MNKVSGFFTLLGAGLAAAAMGTAPAQAAPVADQAATTTASVAQQSPWRDRVVGYYRTYWACVRAGEIGERYGAWLDYSCERVGRPWRWAYALEVEQWGHRYRWTGHWPGTWPGQYRPHWVGTWPGGGNGWPGKGNDNGWPGKGNDNGWPGKGNDNGWPGKGNDNGWPGKGNDGDDNGWPGKGNDNGWPGKGKGNGGNGR